MVKILLRLKKEWVIILIRYLKEKLRIICLVVAMIVFINGYFLYLCGTRLYLHDLLYLDLILSFGAVCLLVRGYVKYNQLEKLKIAFCPLGQEELKDYCSQQVISVIEKNNEYYQNELNYINSQMQELSDYLARWSHEAKLPLASMRLMNERNNDLALQKEMRLTIERLQLLLNTMLMSSKLRNPENDIKIERVQLAQVIKEAIKHHSYFLINDGFTISLDVKNEFVYSDRRWLTYMLDQFISNTIKYKQNNPELKFSIVQNEEEIILMIKDNGIGIAQEDMPYIFDRGFIGHNLRDGDYRSTGMGLYFVKDMAKRLNIQVEVESVSHGSCFKVIFRNNADYFLLDY